MEKFNIRSMILCSLFAALICIGAFIRIAVPFVPFTLQFLFTMLAGLLLGAKLGLISVIVYIAIGLLGLPVFAQGGGLSYIFNPSFGYLIGFAVASFVTGMIANKKGELKNQNLYSAIFIGLIIVYLFGMIYFYFISNFYLGTPIGLWPLFLYGFLLAVPGDIILCLVAATISKRLIPILKKRDSII